MEGVDSEGKQQTDELPERRQTGRLILQPIITVSDLFKTYASGFEALKNINREIRRGEIRARDRSGPCRPPRTSGLVQENRRVRRSVRATGSRTRLESTYRRRLSWT
jgi:hypothetical protein